MASNGSGAADQSADGLAHLQRAALEMIAAARAFLEVAEKVVENPETVRNAVTTVGVLAKAMIDSSTAATSATSSGSSENGSESESKIEHIPLS